MPVYNLDNVGIFEAQVFLDGREVNRPVEHCDTDRGLIIARSSMGAIRRYTGKVDIYIKFLAIADNSQLFRRNPPLEELARLNRRAGT